MIYFDISYRFYDLGIDSRAAIGALPGKCPTPGLKNVLGGLLGGSGGSWGGSGEFRGGSEGAWGVPGGVRVGPGWVPG